MTNQNKRPLQRVQEWPQLLNAFIDKHRDLPFTWGSHDCCLFAGSAVYLMTGVDPAESWRGKYNSVASAMHLAQVRGCFSVAEIAQSMANQYGIPNCPPMMAGRGDLMLFKSNSIEGLGHTLGVVDGNVIYSPGHDKLEAIAIASVWLDPQTKAWKIG